MHCAASAITCEAWPAYICLIETVSQSRLPPAACDHTPLTSGTPGPSVVYEAMVRMSLEVARHQPVDS